MLKKHVTLGVLSFILLAAVLILAIIIYQQHLHKPNMLSQERLVDLRKEYLAYNEDPPFTSMDRPTFESIMERSETVVIGEVVSELPEYTVELVKPGTTDQVIDDKAKSQGLSNSTASFKQYELKVIKHVAGETVEDTIPIVYNAAFVGYEPALKPGMSIITGITKGKDVHEGKYFFTRFGTYYIVDDQYVLSAVDDGFSKTMNGRTLDDLIDRILEIFER